MGALRALAAAVAMLATAAHAAPDCRTTPVYPAGCFGGGRGCRAIPYASQPCFSVRGRLSVWNGSPTFRLRPQGTRRLLGVVGGDGDAASPNVLPSDVRGAMTPRSPGELGSVTGVFRVCPLAPERAGWMRPVCIASASGIAPSLDSPRAAAR
ncbi:MAG TPA: hypothetical protein VGF50_04955 [Caulobacteraceae bacterium]|jgi:hypothetical protein